MGPILLIWLPLTATHHVRFPKQSTLFSADSRLAPSQWETSLQSNAVSHWLGANLESALLLSPVESPHITMSNFPCIVHKRFINRSKRLKEIGWNKKLQKLYNNHNAKIYTLELHFSLQWCHNEPDGVSNHRCLYCLLNRLLSHRSKKPPRHWPLWRESTGDRWSPLTIGQ